jgi:hypothetical protein
VALAACEREQDVEDDRAQGKEGVGGAAAAAIRHLFSGRLYSQGT